jgi:hypothetical protein
MDFKQALSKFKPMVLPDDLHIITELLQFTKPQTILEIGSGGGGWLLTMSTVLTPNIKFIGHEDFRLDYNFDWPKDKDELTTFIKTHNKNIDVTIYDGDVKYIDVGHFKDLNLKFDVVRLDCLEDKRDITELFFKLYPYTSDDCIFLVDDISPNLCPNRFLSYIDRVQDGLLKPIWFGKKEGAFCKTTYECNDVKSHILNVMSTSGIPGKNENITLYNLTYRVILSW